MGLGYEMGDPGSGKNLSWIPDPGVKRHRIPDPYPQRLYIRYGTLFLIIFFFNFV